MTSKMKGRELILNTQRFAKTAPDSIRREAELAATLLLKKFDDLVLSLVANERVLKVYTKEEIEAKNVDGE